MSNQSNTSNLFARAFGRRHLLGRATKVAVGAALVSGMAKGTGTAIAATHKLSIPPVSPPVADMQGDVIAPSAIKAWLPRTYISGDVLSAGQLNGFLAKDTVETHMFLKPMSEHMLLLRQDNGEWKRVLDGMKPWTGTISGSFDSAIAPVQHKPVQLQLDWTGELEAVGKFDALAAINRFDAMLASRFVYDGDGVGDAQAEDEEYDY